MRRTADRSPIQLGKLVVIASLAAMLYPVFAIALVLLRYTIIPKELSKGSIASIILASFLMLLLSFSTFFIAIMSQGGRKKSAIICSVAGVVLNLLFLATQGTV